MFLLDLYTNNRRYSWNKFNYIQSMLLKSRVVNAWRCFSAVVAMNGVINFHRRFGFFFFFFIIIITILDSNHKNVLTKIFHLRISIMMHVIPLEFPFGSVKWCAKKKRRAHCTTIFFYKFILSKILPPFLWEKQEKKTEKYHFHLCVELWIWDECDWRGTNHSA